MTGLDELVSAIHSAVEERKRMKLAIQEWVAANDALDACEHEAAHGRCSCVHEARLHAAEAVLRSLA